jgi:ubiquinone/menaquinone biosynthesis C-methylase UbiE
VVPLAEGRVLDVGAGAALNLPFYDRDKVDLVWCLEPSGGMRKLAEKNLKRSPLNVKWIGLPAESIPLEDRSVDTVLLTYTLCTIPDWATALIQMRRVLKPRGI